MNLFEMGSLINLPDSITDANKTYVRNNAENLSPEEVLAAQSIVFVSPNNNPYKLDLINPDNRQYILTKYDMRTRKNVILNIWKPKIETVVIEGNTYVGLYYDESENSSHTTPTQGVDEARIVFDSNGGIFDNKANFRAMYTPDNSHSQPTLLNETTVNLIIPPVFDPDETFEENDRFDLKRINGPFELWVTDHRGREFYMRTLNPIGNANGMPINIITPAGSRLAKYNVSTDNWGIHIVDPSSVIMFSPIMKENLVKRPQHFANGLEVFKNHNPRIVIMTPEDGVTLVNNKPAISENGQHPDEFDRIWIGILYNNSEIPTLEKFLAVMPLPAKINIKYLK